MAEEKDRSSSRIIPGTGGIVSSGSQPGVVEKSATDSLSAASADSPPAGPSRPIGRRGETLAGRADLTLQATGILSSTATVTRKEDVARPVEAMLRDPLSDVGRKERRSLLGVSVVAILVGWTGLVPEKIENLGITFTAPARAGLLWVLLAVVVYYTLAFVFYAMSDFLSYRHAVHLGNQEIRRQRLKSENVKDDLMTPGDQDVSRPWRWIRSVPTVAVIRGTFDFGIPLLVAFCAIILLVLVLLGASPTIQPAPTLPPLDGI